MPEKGKTFAGEVREETVAWSKDTYQLLKQAEQGKVKSYVQDIALAVLDCKETATSRETFIRLMNERGYGVDWQDSHKYITYTDLAREQAGEKPNPEVYLSLLMLSANLQGKGVGSHIYLQFEREMIQDGKNSIRIDVVNDYQRNVVPFWKRQGFLEKENVTLAWGKKKSNAVVMKKNLQ